MEANSITLRVNGRLTEHIAHVDVGGKVQTLTYRNHSGRTVKFDVLKLVLTYQWSWSRSAWHLLEVKALGRNGVQDVHVKFTNPENAPGWVQDAVEMASPTLELPINDAGESKG